LFFFTLLFCHEKHGIIGKPEKSSCIQILIDRRFEIKSVFALNPLLKPLTEIIALFRQRISWVAAILLALYNMQQDGRPSNQVRPILLINF
jgi:hypothetical protein